MTVPNDKRCIFDCGNVDCAQLLAGDVMLPFNSAPCGRSTQHATNALRCFDCVQVFAGLLVGAMLPFWFSAMTMKSVGKAALAMVEEVRRQFNTINGLMEGTARPDYSRCVKISTDSSLKEMIPPGESTRTPVRCLPSVNNILST